MKKTLLVALLFAPQFMANAIENGTQVNISDYPDMINMNCTHTVIGADFVITAAHCDPLFYVRDNPVTADYDHPDRDIRLINTENDFQITKIHFISQAEIKNGDVLKTFGFGGNNELNFSVQEVDADYYSSEIILGITDIGQGISVAGDSGGASLNAKNEIVSVVKGVGSGVTAVTRILDAKDFILDTINGWHFPTLAETTNGEATIEIQSLHAASFMDNATASGDITILGGTCYGAITEPLDICTYDISSVNNYQGFLTLDDGEVITINKGKAAPAPTPDNSDSGGSLGWFALLALIAGARRYHYGRQ